MKRQDFTGSQVGRLLVLEFAHSDGHRVYWKCRCECGTVCEVRADHLKSEKIKSCGCLRVESGIVRGLNSVKHGELIGIKSIESPEYDTWSQMKQRCFNPNCDHFDDYGGRGITVCDRWKNDFAAFLSDMGRRPTPYHSIDRYPDVNGNYEPGNCRWATAKEQNNNQRKHRKA